MTQSNGWIRNENLVLSKLVEHGKKIDRQSKLIGDLRIEVAMLKVRAGIWGMIGGAFPVLIGLGIMILKSAL